MKQLFIISLLLTSLGATEVVYVNKYANKDRKDPNEATRSGFNGNIDIGYTSYLININSSELSRAIDYNVLEATLGASYAYADWIWGVDTKVLVHEENSNLTSSSGVLYDHANIDRNEFSLFTNYKINEQLRANLLYRYSSLQSNDDYVAFKDYATTFNYTTNGIATSLVYTPTMVDGLFFSTGIAYSKADVQIYENINSVADDVSIDDSSFSLGLKLSGGYNYAFKNDIVLKLSADWYKFDFGELDVYSNTLKEVLEQASLEEETYSLRFGLAYRF